MAIDKEWLHKFAYKVATCPKCKRRSFGLIFEGKVTGEIWECAERTCGYNPAASQKRFK